MRRVIEYAAICPTSIGNNLYENWGYDKHQNQFLNVAETAQRHEQESLSRSSVANGYYDLATPYFATEYTFNHLGIDAELYPQHQHGLLRRGPHDVHPRAVVTRLKQDLAGFMDATLGAA
ncbi:MAG: hypothetical protein R2851_13565 [Caldilineaceae bacterium]